MNKGMLPLPLAFDVERDIYDFLDVFFEIKGNSTGDELRKYYRETNPIVKGPFIKVSLPYMNCSSQDENPLSLKTDYLPYIHQINSFKRLHHPNPQNTVITTGTGSGKTECFMYPFLDYVTELKNKGQGEGALKAIILYPMNALLDDQTIRFSKAIKEHKLESLGIRIGKYTGDNGNQRVMDLSNNKVIDNRDELCKNPPDILLTNYKMLDYMLFRQKEKTFWNKKTAQYLKYLALDEMHTFDGASGADVACLIRRLKQVAYGDAEVANSKLTCIGTSATLSSDPNAKNELITFAKNLFGSSFNEECIIEETRHSIETYLGSPSPSIDKIPNYFKTNTSITGYQFGDSLDAYVDQILTIFGFDGYLNKKSKLASELKSIDILQFIVKICSTETKEFNELIHILEENFPEHLDLLGGDGFKSYIASLLTLSSFARNENRDSAPFLTIKCSLWASELKRLLKKVASTTPNLNEFIDDTIEIDSSSLYLPAVYCTYCGENGWYTRLEGNADNMRRPFNSNITSLRTMWARNEGSIIFPVNDNNQSQEIHYLYPGSKAIFREEQGIDEDYPKELGTPIPILEATLREGRCPCCDSKLRVRPFAIGGSSLTSLISSSMFSHPLNGDKKAISFSDSVQDASHQASFLNNRSYTFYFRRTISKALSEGKKLSEIQKDLFTHYNFSNMTVSERIDFVGKFIPDKLKKKWQLLASNQDNKNYTDKVLTEVKNYVDYSTFCEFTTNSKLGWTFEKVGHGGLFVDEDLWSKLISTSRNIWQEQDEKLEPFSDNNTFSQFLYALIQRWKSHGVMYSPYLESYYGEKRASPYPFMMKYPYLRSATFNIPKFFSPVVNTGIKEYEALGGNNLGIINICKSILLARECKASFKIYLIGYVNKGY